MARTGFFWRRSFVKLSSSAADLPVGGLFFETSLKFANWSEFAAYTYLVALFFLEYRALTQRPGKLRSCTGTGRLRGFGVSINTVFHNGFS
jgi:hypothetical protein